MPAESRLNRTWSASAASGPGMVHRRRFLGLAAAACTAAWSRRIPAAEKRWRVGVIGHTGHGDYGHGLATMWLGLPETKIVGLADANAAGLEKMHGTLGNVPAFADYREMLAQARPELVAICPRHIGEHREMALAAIAAGARGLYCEKPFCRTPAEADEIVAACRKSGAKLAIAHRNHYHPALPVTRRALQDGEIGQLLEIRCRGKEDTRGGAPDLWVLGSHLFDYVRYFVGDAAACSAVILQGARPARPDDLVEGAEGVGPLAGDRLHARFEMQDGLPVYFDSIRNAGVRAAGFGVQLIGTKGIIDLRTDAETMAHLVPGNPFQPTAEPRPWIPITSGGVGQPEPLKNLNALVAQHQLPGRDLIQAISDDRPPLCSDVDGRGIIEMIHATFASHVKNGERVPLPLENREHPFARWGRA